MPTPIEPEKLSDKIVELERRVVGLDKIEARIAGFEERIDRLAEDRREMDRLQDVEIELTKVTLENETLRRELEKQQALENKKDQEIQKIQTALTDLQEKNRQLDNQIKDLSAKTPAMDVRDVAAHFQQVIAETNVAGLARKEAKAVIEQMEVEIKGGIDMAEGMKLSQIPVGEITKESVSTVRFRLKPVTEIKMTE